MRELQGLRRVQLDLIILTSLPLTTHEVSWLECELVRLIYCGLILQWRECSVVFVETHSRHVLSIAQPAERKRMILDLVVRVPVVLLIVIPSREDRTMRETNRQQCQWSQQKRSVYSRPSVARTSQSKEKDDVLINVGLII